MNFTIVTGLWDLGRGDLKDFSRSFDHYLESFEKLLKLDFNMCIFVPSELVKFVSDRRKPHNTKIYIKELSDIEKLVPNFNAIQNIRTNKEWYSQASWLENSPQAKLKYYNPVVMSKFMFVEESSKDNPFNTDYFFWIDGGIANTVDIDHIKQMNKIDIYMDEINDRFLFLAFPYDNNNEVHGFNTKKLGQFCGVEKPEYVCRGGFFGGHKDKIEKFTERYKFFLKDSLDLGYMGTEECIHTVLAYRYDDEVQRFMLNENGLIHTFFMHLKGIQYFEIKNVDLIPYDKKKDVMDIKTSLYVLTYNSPSQFERLIESYQQVDADFINTPRKILIDNSTNQNTYVQYQELCKKYGFEHIKKEENVGICGGRQFVAEHFNESDSEYYIFLEDDMNLNTKEDICDAGYRTYTENLYQKSLTIMHKERYDFLKLSFSEFYGNNQVQWAWYNIPKKARVKYFPDNPVLPEHGFDDNAPKIVATASKRFKDLYYLEGDYYYCNWPLWFSRQGNAKVFLNLRWSHPLEQTWMSYCFQQQQKGKIRSAVLELSPIFHHRFDHYPAEERKES